MEINSNDVVPALVGEDLEQVKSAARRLGIAGLTDDEIHYLRRHVSQHVPATGYQVDSAAAVACGLELKRRSKKNHTSAMDKAIALLQEKFGFECPTFDRVAHKDEVDCGDTRLWFYWEWVVHQIESDGLEVEKFIIGPQVADIPGHDCLEKDIVYTPTRERPTA